MKICVNTLLLLFSRTGVGNYVYQICRNLQQIDPRNDYTFFYGYYSKFLRPPEKSISQLTSFKDRIGRTPFLGTALKKFKGARNWLSSPEFDLYFEPNYIPLNIKSSNLVTTVFDFSWALFPQWHPRERIRHFEKHFWENIKRAERIIVISDYIRGEAIHRFGLPAERVVSIPLGVDHDVFRIYPEEELKPLRSRYGLPERFILFVGSIEPRKNLKNLLQAYLNLGESVRREIKLVLVGFNGWNNDEVMALIRKGKKDISYLGYLPEEDLARMYNLARLFIYPSFYEGFGLPPLEAMACGCPVVVSKTSSLPEACGEAACYVLPEDMQSIIKGIVDVWENEELRQSLIRKGLERAKLFTWEKTAREHLKVFEKFEGAQPR